RGFADVEVDFAGGSADVAKIGVRHLTGAIDDAPHDGNAHTFEMPGGGADAGGGFLKIKQRSPAAGAGHVIRLENTGSGGLQNVEREPETLAGGLFSLNENGIP